MYVRETRDINDFLQCLQMEQVVRKKKRDKSSLSDMIDYLGRNFRRNPLMRMFMAFSDDDEMIGYTILNINPDTGAKNIHIYRTWYKGDPEIQKTFWKIIKALATDYGCDTCTIEVYKNARAYERKWGFKPYSMILERGI